LDNFKHHDFQAQKNDKEDILDNIDIIKLVEVLRKNIFWAILIIVASIGTAYVYLRYTKAVFLSASELKLDIKSDATVFGFNSFEENLNNLSSEKELLMSRLFHNQVIDALDLEVSYYAHGNVLYEERYRNSPFIVQFEIKNNGIFDKPFNVELLNDKEFLLEYPFEGLQSNAYHYGQIIETPSLTLVVNLTHHYSPDNPDKKYFFRINSRENLLNYIANNMNVEYLNLNAKTIRITFKDHNKFKARDMVNAIDTLYLLYSYEEKKKATRQKIDFLNEQLASTEDKLETFEDYFEDFTIKNMTINLKSDLNKTILQLESLDTLRYEANMRLNKLNELYTSILNDQTYLINPIERAAYPIELTSANEQLNNLLKERELLLSSYRENSFAVRKKSQEIDFLRTNLLSLLELIRTQQFEKLKTLNQEKRRLERSFITLPSKETEFNKTSRYYALYEDFYLSLMQRKTEFEIAQAGTVTDFVILSPASLPGNPIYPPKLMIYSIGLLVGIILSVLLIAISYVLHNKITGQLELEHLTSAPSLGIVPFYKNGHEENQPIVGASPKSAVSEALRTIRTNMDFINLSTEKRVISVTSTISGEGKSFIAINLGGIIAYSGLKVVIVDLDMRKPKINSVFNINTGSKGVSSLLIGKYPLEECIFSTPMENLKFVPAGPIPPNPAELLLSHNFNEFLENLKMIFDVVILDTPPIGLVTDGIIAMRKADLPLYIFRAHYSKRFYTKTLNRLIKVNNFKNIAVVLNAVKSPRGQGYGYGYGYNYTSSGYYDDEAINNKIQGIDVLKD
jgi:tyrosine-protein kinase Etk/Wzc